MLKRLVAGIAPLLLTQAAVADCRGTFVSPDKAITATVAAHSKDSKEGVVEFRSIDGQAFLKKDYSSGDGEHGQVIGKCAWTKDSQFFVYSSYSSGGHQAWHFETTFYARQENKLYELDDFVGPVTDPDFTLKDQDIVHTFGWLTNEHLVHIISKVPSGQDEEPYFEYDVSLTKLLKDPHPSKSN